MVVAVAGRQGVTSPRLGTPLLPVGVVNIDPPPSSPSSSQPVTQRRDRFNIRAGLSAVWTSSLKGATTPRRTRGGDVSRAA